MEKIIGSCLISIGIWKTQDDITKQFVSG